MFDDNRHLNRFPLGRRLRPSHMDFVNDTTARFIYSTQTEQRWGEHGVYAEPNEHFVPLMMQLHEIRTLPEARVNG